MTKGIITLLLLLLTIPVQAETRISMRFGGISSDILGGNGGSKAMLETSLSTCKKFGCLDLTLWQITEPLDDDIGIVPESGYSLTATKKLGIWRLGAHRSVMDNWKENYIAAGIGGKHGAVLLLIPSGNARYGTIVEINTPITKDWFISSRYSYTGRQDPDIKVSRIGFGIGRQF